MKRVLALLAAGLLGSSFAAAQRKPAPPAPAPAAPRGAAAVAPKADAQQPAPDAAAEDATSGRGYTYDPAGRRDPFRSLLVRNDSKQPGARPPGIAGIGVDDITVQGIWKTRSGYVAQIRGTDNKSYLLRAGDLLWDGEVTRVGPNEVGFRQNLNDPQSVKPFRDVTKQLNTTTAKQ
jgi:type IV pilus assembly protein PilP